MLRGYPLPMVLAEKIVTAIERGTANTRWRDFADIYLLTGVHAPTSGVVRRAVHTVAGYRNVTIRPLRESHDGYAVLAQPRWAAWRHKQRLDAVLPEQFNDVLTAVWAFTDPLLGESGQPNGAWHSDTRQWR
jgi:hypothetical protein